MKIVFSETAVQQGYGSMPYKSVIHLTREERQILRDGGEVLFLAARPSHPSLRKINYAYLRRVKYDRGYFNPRVPSAELIAVAVDNKWLKPDLAV